MRQSARLAEKRAKAENESQRELKAKKKRSNDKISNIATLDNGTMVEAFKYLNYCQLAKKSLVSKRFRDLIQTHRHKLALLYVRNIGMYSNTIGPAATIVFDKKLTSDEYNEWVVRNKYSKQVSLDSQVGGKQNTQNGFNDLNHRKLNDRTGVFYARVELNCENWPLFQHFIRLAADPFIYIDNMNLTPQNDVLNLLAGAINPDRRLQCNNFRIHRNSNSQKFITWTKNHVRCNQFYIYGKSDLSPNEGLVDFFLTGAHCAPSIIISRVLSKAIVSFVEKFLELKTSDESNLVEAIAGYFKNQDIELLKREYADFIVKEERHENDRSTEEIFEFGNDDIGKKLMLTINDDVLTICHDWAYAELQLRDSVDPIYQVAT
ncbi:hypothetical protein DdX_13325 [Ditylenchus destructor]|uniref:F-box domain-containing protein n=1 Tax=Ditylenchus destructor TaxID=166010 RepID=A0AAD4MT19_9BILA|nr:hypothetical protein DdX_13325 [Ditylenchus destructor]